VDLEAIRAAGHPTATALIVTNSDDLPEISVAANGDAAAGTPVFKFKK
jgi:PTS system glucose-specific IIA component